jgi:hypothetical protein
MPRKLSGQLFTNAERDGLSFEGCRVSALFDDRSPDDPDTPSAVSDAAGRFALLFPDGEIRSDVVRFVVSSPDGRTIGETEVKTGTLRDSITIEVEGLDAEPPPPPPEPPPAPPEPARAPEVPGRTAVDAAFKFDAAFRGALTENLTPLRARTDAIATRVEAAFATFTPTPLSEEELDARHYVEPDTDPSVMLENIIKERTHEIGSSDATHTLTLRDGDDLKQVTKNAAGDRHVDLHDLLGFINGKLGGGSIATEPVYSACDADMEAESRVVAIEKGAAGNGAGPPNGHVDAPGSPDADQLVKDSVNIQMHSATSPETRLEYGAMPSIPNTAGKDEVQSTILQTFELRPGASDVTSYHDFHTLQIAFAHVWTRIFDGQLESLGRELYGEYVKLKDFSGTNGDDLSVGTVDDLRRLMDEVRKLSQTVETDIPSDLRGGGGDPGTKGGAKGSNILSDIAKGAVVVATGGVSWLLEMAFQEFSRLGQKPIITWDQFPGPWPPRRDRIEVTYDVAPAGMVEIQLKTDPDSHIKILEFEPWDPASRTFIHGAPYMRLSNAGHVEVVAMTLQPSQLASGCIEFASEETSAADTPGRYVLGDLASGIKDGTRVTFYWKDS